MHLVVSALRNVTDVGPEASTGQENEKKRDDRSKEI
jgi:hypothetical protein